MSNLKDMFDFNQAMLKQDSIKTTCLQKKCNLRLNLFSLLCIDFDGSAF